MKRFEYVLIGGCEHGHKHIFTGPRVLTMLWAGYKLYNASVFVINYSDLTISTA